MPGSSAQLTDLSESGPVKGLRSLANPNTSSVSHSVPHTHTASPASLQEPKASLTLRCPSNGESNPQPGVYNVPKKDLPAQDDFDDWDVDLDELDDCAPQKTSASDADLASDSISPAKRTKLFTVSEDTPSSLRGFCNSTPKSAPVHPACSTSFYPQNSVQTFVPPACRFTNPITPGPVRGTSPWHRGAVSPRPEHRSLFQAVSPAPATPQTPRPLHTPVLTNHLVQLVSAASKTPHRPRSDSVRSKTRRFPGPAGALPQQVTPQSSLYRNMEVV